MCTWEDIIQLFKCNQCNYEVNQPAILDSHIRSTQNNLWYHCEFCVYKASQKCSLRTHVEMKHEGLLFGCDDFEYKSRNQSILESSASTNQTKNNCWKRTSHLFKEAIWRGTYSFTVGRNHTSAYGATIYATQPSPSKLISRSTPGKNCTSAINVNIKRHGQATWWGTRRRTPGKNFTIAINAITKQQNQARWRDTRGRTLKKSHTDAQRASIRALQLVIWRFTWWQSTPEKSRSSVTSATMLALILVICSATWGRILGRDHSSATNAARLTKIREILQNISKFIVPKYGSVSRWLNQMQLMWWTSKGNRISPDNDLVLRLHFRTQSLFGQRVSRVAEVLFNMVLVIDFFSHSTQILEFIFLPILSGTWFGLDDKDDNDPLIRNRHGLDKTSTKYYHLYHDSYHDSYHYYQSMPITMIRMN